MAPKTIIAKPILTPWFGSDFLSAESKTSYASQTALESSFESPVYVSTSELMTKSEFSKELSTTPTIVVTAANAPLPTSLHARIFVTGDTTMQPHSLNVLRATEVAGWSHIIVFIAGQMTHGFLKSQALKTQSSKVSDIPQEIFARMSAEAGATTKMSAQRRSSMCKTTSPTLFHKLHSHLSVTTRFQPPMEKNSSQTALL